MTVTELLLCFQLRGELKVCPTEISPPATFPVCSEIKPFVGEEGQSPDSEVFVHESKCYQGTLTF